MKTKDIKVHLFWNRKGVRLTHVPTGKTAECDVHDSQLKNRATALELLKKALGEMPAVKGKPELRTAITDCGITKKGEPLARVVWEALDKIYEAASGEEAVEHGRLHRSAHPRLRRPGLTQRAAREARAAAPPQEVTMKNALVFTLWFWCIWVLTYVVATAWFRTGVS